MAEGGDDVRPQSLKISAVGDSLFIADERGDVRVLGLVAVVDPEVIRFRYRTRSRVDCTGTLAWGAVRDSQLLRVARAEVVAAEAEHRSRAAMWAWSSSC